MFTASLPPAVIASTLTALTRLEEDSSLRTRLAAHADRLYDGLSGMGFMTGPTSSPIVAITMPDTERAIGMWNALLQNGVYLNLALPPATPDSRPLLRTSVSAAHSFEQIDQVLAVFAEIGVAMGLIEAPLKRVSA
jgi:8-amino-7-oxononanoate synthase